jgi:DNA-binding IclR family transcriptional regulator
MSIDLQQPAGDGIDETQHAAADQSAGAAARNGDPVGSLHRAVQLVRAVARGRAAGASLKDLVGATGLPRPTIHRVTQMLIDVGWLERDRENRRFFLGREVHSLGLVAALRHPIERIAAAELARLAHETGQTIYMLTRAGDDSVCVARHESTARIQTLVLQVGTREPLGIGAGSMALLAALPQDDAEQAIMRNMARYRRNERFDEPSFRRALSEARTRGFASHDGLFIRGVSGIGVAVRDESGYPLAAISTAFVTDWLDTSQREQLARRIEAGAGMIAAALISQRATPVASSA